MTKKARIGVSIKKCTCKKEPCECGSHGPKLIDPEAHRRFVKNIFALVDDRKA